jgi:hypothetical protein
LRSGSTNGSDTLLRLYQVVNGILVAVLVMASTFNSKMWLVVWHGNIRMTLPAVAPTTAVAPKAAEVTAAEPSQVRPRMIQQQDLQGGDETSQGGDETCQSLASDQTGDQTCFSLKVSAKTRNLRWCSSAASNKADRQLARRPKEEISSSSKDTELKL